MMKLFHMHMVLAMKSFYLFSKCIASNDFQVSYLLEDAKKTSAV